MTGAAALTVNVLKHRETPLNEDQDGDGFAAAGAACIARGEAGGEHAFPRTDCDDLNPSVHPTSHELCDGIDSDSDGAPEDVDGDGYAAPDAACIGAGEPGALPATFPRTDCDDLDPAIQAC